MATTLITVVTGGHYAPGCYILCRAYHNSFSYSEYDEANTILIQSDWEFPSVAASFGYVPCDQCHQTDGTVDCEHRTVMEMIADAADYLDDCEGEFITDPGYFTEDEENVEVK